MIHHYLIDGILFAHLKIYYRRVDFRDLVRDLFTLFETRIWMSQVDALPIYNSSAKNAIMTGLVPSHDISNDWTSSEI